MLALTPPGLSINLSHNYISYIHYRTGPVIWMHDSLRNISGRGGVLKKKWVDAIRSGQTPDVCKVKMYIQRTKWIISYEVCRRRPPTSTPDYTPEFSGKD